MKFIKYVFHFFRDCPEKHHDGYSCSLPRIHNGDHISYGADGNGPPVECARWPRPKHEYWD